MADEMSILVVENGELEISNLRELLENHGYNVSVARDDMELLDVHDESAQLAQRNIQMLLVGRTDLANTDCDGVFGLLLSAYRTALRKDQEVEALRHDLERTQQTIKELERNYRVLIETEPDAVIVLDQKAQVRFLNQAAEGLLQGREDELIRQVFAFPLSEAESKEIRFESRNGEKSVAEIRIMETVWEGENAYLVFLHDITDHRRAAEALRESMNREAQAYAQGRLEIVDTILHNVGNAINSVTIGIGTVRENLANNKLTRHLVSLANAVKEHEHDFADYVRDDPRGQKVARFIIALADDFVKHDQELMKTADRVHERAERIADIIRTEKTLSKRNAYQKYVSPHEAIKNAVAVLHDSIKKRNIKVSIDCKDAPDEIVTQESQFHQMLVNLIKNAIEAIDELGKLGDSPHNASIDIKAYTKSNLFVLEVTDSGIGIEKDKLELIFKAGYTTKESGSGLGLHSIANFVNMCGGQISSISDGIGRGTTMKVMLPVSLRDS